MDKKFEELYKEWKHEEKIAHMQGWDFSHISQRYVEEDDLPWDFKSVIKKYPIHRYPRWPGQTESGDTVKKTGRKEKRCTKRAVSEMRRLFFLFLARSLSSQYDPHSLYSFLYKGNARTIWANKKGLVPLPM